MDGMRQNESERIEGQLNRGEIVFTYEPVSVFNVGPGRGVCPKKL